MRDRAVAVLVDHGVDGVGVRSDVVALFLREEGGLVVLVLRVLLLRLLARGERRLLALEAALLAQPVLEPLGAEVGLAAARAISPPARDKCCARGRASARRCVRTSRAATSSSCAPCGSRRGSPGLAGRALMRLAHRCRTVGKRSTRARRGSATELVRWWLPKGAPARTAGIKSRATSPMRCESPCWGPSVERKNEF